MARAVWALSRNACQARGSDGWSRMGNCMALLGPCKAQATSAITLSADYTALRCDAPRLAPCGRRMDKQSRALDTCARDLEWHSSPQGSPAPRGGTRSTWLAQTQRGRHTEAKCQRDGLVAAPTRTRSRSPSYRRSSEVSPSMSSRSSMRTLLARPTTVAAILMMVAAFWTTTVSRAMRDLCSRSHFWIGARVSRL